VLLCEQEPRAQPGAFSHDLVRSTSATALAVLRSRGCQCLATITRHIAPLLFGTI